LKTQQLATMNLRQLKDMNTMTAMMRKMTKNLTKMKNLVKTKELILRMTNIKAEGNTMLHPT